MRLLNIIVICLTICIACSPSGHKQYIQYEKSSDFSEVVEIAVDTLEIPLIARVSQILSADSIIKIQTEGTPMWVYTLNLENLSVTDSIFPKGAGPGEYMNVAISPINDTNELLIVDNRQMKWYRIAKNVVMESGNTGHFIVSDIHDVGFPIVGYVDFRSDGLRLKIRDLHIGVDTDSLVIPNINLHGESIVDNFVWNYDKATGRFALAFTDQNKLLIGRITSGKLDDIKVLVGNSMSNHIYYTDVKIDEDKLWALTQNDVNLDTYDGHSSIEIYDFDGNPIKKIKLPVIAQTTAIDQIKSIVFLVSATDDNLYSFRK